MREWIVELEGRNSDLKRIGGTKNPCQDRTAARLEIRASWTLDGQHPQVAASLNNLARSNIVRPWASSIIAR